MSNPSEGRSKRSKRPPRKESPSQEAREALARALAKQAVALAQEEKSTEPAPKQGKDQGKDQGEDQGEEQGKNQSTTDKGTTSASLSERIAMPAQRRKKNALELALEAAEREANAKKQKERNGNTDLGAIEDLGDKDRSKKLTSTELKSLSQEQQYDLVRKGYLEPLPTLEGLECVRIMLVENVFTSNSNWLDHRRRHLKAGELHLASLCSVVLDQLGQNDVLLGMVLLRWRADHFLLIYDFASEKQLALMPNGTFYL